MTDLRTAAQQALEALNSIDVGYRSPSGNPLELSFDEGKCEAAITALRAALAQQEEPHPGYPCRSDGRCQYAIDHGAEGLGSCPKGKCAIAQPQPAEDRAVAQDNLRVMREMFGEQDEPVQEQAEPVAWLQPKTVDGYSRPDLGYETCSRDDYGAFPVHTSPPQRKPLTEEEIDGLVIQHAGYGRDNFYAVARAVERAHGIKE